MGAGSLKFIDYLSRTGVNFNQNPMAATEFSFFPGILLRECYQGVSA